MRSQTTRRPQTFEEKMTLRFLILFVASFVVVFLLDGFMLHPIPAPEDTFQVLRPEETIRFDLFKTDLPYSNAAFLDSDTSHWDCPVYLVKKDNQAHLLVFEVHFITQRAKLVGDIVIDPTMDETYRAPAFLGSYHVTVSGGRLTSIQWKGFPQSTTIKHSHEVLFYTIFALALASLDNFLYRKFRKTHKSKTN